MLIIPYPFVTFGLFYTARDIGLGKGIKFKTVFVYGKDYWKPAYIWGGLNLLMLVVLWMNIRFYSGLEAQWAGFVQLIFVALIIFWLILQLISLAIYPRLVEPGFKLALRNAAVIMARYPLAVLVYVGLIILIGVVSIFFSVIGFLLGFSFIAILTNSMAEILVGEELKRLGGSE